MTDAKLTRVNMSQNLYRKPELCQVSYALPTVKCCRALGKEIFCRVSALGKGWLSAKRLFAECRALGKAQHSAKTNGGTHRHPLPSATVWHSAKRLFAECQNWALGKDFFCFLPLNFFFWLYTLFWRACSNLAQFLIYFLYIFNLFYLNIFLKMENWTVGASNHRIWRLEKIIFMIRIIVWGRLQEYARNFERLIHETWQ